MRVSLGLGLGILLVACGGGAQAVAPAPVYATPEGPTQTDRVASVDAFALPSDHEPDHLPEEPKTAPDLDTWKKLKTAKGLAARPTTCKLPKAVKATPACADEQSSLGLLDTALGKPDAERDAALAGLESCKLPAGFVTALRAELAPVECADGITDPALDKLPAGITPTLQHLLVGQSLGSKLSRTVIGQPTLKPPYSKAETQKFLTTKLAPWAQAQALLVQQLSALGATLSGVGQAVLAVEAGRADLRFVEVARQVPTAPEFQKDPELRQIYESALEQALEPRKARGRDATLVGLRIFADYGVISGSTRMQHARELLASMYGGRRVDALDGLMIPAAGKSAAPESPRNLVPPFLRMQLASAGAALAAEANGPGATVFAPEVRKAALPDGAVDERAGRARTSLRLAGAHFRRASADTALDLVASLPRAEPTEFLVALALALHQGPKDVVTMMAAGAPSALGYRKLDALDAVAKKGGAFAGAAAYDAALLREVAPPDGAGKKYFEDLAAQYHAAEKKLGVAPEAKLAADRAKHAEEIAAAAK
jgi:hypothetical protein